jgi:poly(3-hydroxybutyrate) depolymerase
MFVLWLLACTPGAEAPDGPLAAPLAEPTAGACPTVSGSGRVALLSNGLDREAEVYAPAAGAAGKPLIFLWHGTGDNAARLGSVLRLDDLADDFDATFVVPDARDENLLEWEFRTEGENDLAFYDDLRTCVGGGLDADLDALSTTGFSAGGLWASFLLMRRSDTLSAALPMSGGTDPIVEFIPPAEKTPTLLTWGGEDDVWGASGLFEVRFEPASLAFAAQLSAAGHTVVTCDHGGGHSFPRAWEAIWETWLLGHRYGEPSPFAEGPLDALPSGCARP